MIKKWFLIISSLVWAVSLQEVSPAKSPARSPTTRPSSPYPASMCVEGTGMGAITDISGQYTILNVPPGSYTVRASMIGYTTMRVEGSGSPSI